MIIKGKKVEGGSSHSKQQIYKTNREPCYPGMLQKKIADPPTNTVKMA